MSKSLFCIKMEHESFIVAENKQEALEEFWERKNDIQTNVDNFIDDITNVYEVDEAFELVEHELEEESKCNQ